MKNFKYKLLDIDCRPTKRNTKLYIFLKGENVMDNLLNRRSRPHEEWQKYLLPQIIKRVKSIKNFQRADWNQNCGCSCGCSPGFDITHDGKDVDIYVDIQMSVNEKRLVSECCRARNSKSEFEKTKDGNYNGFCSKCGEYCHFEFQSELSQEKN